MAKEKKLTRSQSLYCANRATGEMGKAESYLASFPRCKSKGSAITSSALLEKDERIQAEIKRLLDATETEETLSRQEKRIRLARIVRVNSLAIDPDDSEDANADLVESVKRNFDKDGNHISTTFKIPSKLKAIEIDNRLAGHNEPDEVNHHIDGGVMLVPTGADSLDDWEKDAVKQQGELTKPTNKKAP